MTVLADLVSFYEMVAAAGDAEMPRRFWSQKTVSWELVLHASGRPISLVPLTDESGKHTRRMMVPQGQRSSGVVPYFLSDNTEYYFANDSKRGDEKKAACAELHHAVLDGIDDAGARAVLLFVDGYSSPSLLDDPGFEILRDSPRDPIVFRLEGDDCYVHQRPAVADAWDAYETALEEGLEKSPCLISGAPSAPRARLFPQVTGFPGAQSSGASLVGANHDSFLSYGQDSKDDIGAISLPAADKASAALTYLSRSMKHRCRMGNDLVTFWADATDARSLDALMLLFSPEMVQADSAFVSSGAEDETVRADVQNQLERIRSGRGLAEIEPSTGYHVLCIAPNQARLSVRFYETGTFGDLEKNVRLYLEDTHMVGVAPRSLRSFVEQTAPLGKAENIPSPLITSSWESYLRGTMFPVSLFSQLVARTRVDHGSRNRWDLGLRAAMMKAYLLRVARNRGEDEVTAYGGSLTVALNESCESTAYLLGRLFALIEKAQTDAIGGNTNATVRDKYMSAASTTPARVFPQLLSLSQRHVSKLRKAGSPGAFLDRRIQEVMDHMDSNGFPATLTLEEQGVFFIGYYQQRTDLYTKKSTNETSEDEVSAE